MSGNNFKLWKHCWFHGQRHAWSDWWWVRYLVREARICQRCGVREERKHRR